MRLSARKLVLEIMAFVGFAVVAGAGLLAWQLSRGPVDLDIVKASIERSLSQARGGLPVRLDSIGLEWSREQGRVEVAAKGVSALDQTGKVVSQAERAAISFDAAALLGGKLKTRALRLEGGHAIVVRSKDRIWSMAGITLLKEPPPAESLFKAIDNLDWTTIATPVRALISAGSFERLELKDFSLDVIDQASGATWAANPVNGVWTASHDGVAFELDLRFVGSGDPHRGGDQPNRLVIALAADPAVTRTQARLAFEGVDPVTAATMFGYAGHDFTSGRPANATITLDASEASGVDMARLQLSGVTGHAKVDGLDLQVDNLAFEAAYNPSAQRIDLAYLSLRSDRLSGEFSGSVDVRHLIAADAAQPTPFTLKGGDITLNATPVFEKPWSIASIDLTAQASPDFSRLTVSSLKAVSGGLTATASGEAWLDGPAGERKLGLKLAAQGAGVITPAQVLEYWPVELGVDGREWVRKNIRGGRATKAIYTVDWPPGANAQGFLADEVMTLDFDIADASVAFLDDFPPATRVAATGHLTGNSISFNVTGGSLESWTIDEGRILLPHFHPAGGVMEIDVAGHGALRDLMRVLDKSNLKVGTKYGLNIEQMAGEGGLMVKIRRPMLHDVPDKDWSYQVSGGFHNASAPDLAAGFGLVDSDVRVELSQAGLSLSGGGKFGPAPVMFSWKEGFQGPASTGSDLTATAKVTPDLLNAFGIAARTVMQGEADVTLHASGAGRDFSEISANFDLTRAAIDLSELGWNKKFDAPATGTFRYGKDGESAVMTGDIRADGLELSGEVQTAAGGVVQRGVIEHIYSRGSVDLRGDFSRRPDGGYRLAVSGPFFDASPWMDSFLTVPSAKPREAALPDAVAASRPDPVFDIQLVTDRLRLRDNAELNKVNVSLQLDSKGPRSGFVKGTIQGKKGVDVRIASDGDARTVSIKSDDAGFGGRVLMKADYFTGGTLDIQGRFAGSKGEAQIVMQDVRMRDAPLVAQVLSLASLRGLTDVLSGDGVLFTRVEAPLRIIDGRIEIPGLRASGPAMGFTARGWVAPGSGDISLDGVLVPSFGVNSALGGLPIIGDLFVSRQGEGLFAPTYSVRGSLEKARVAINPISAFTPGVLRRIFENPTEAPPMADATVTPPQPRN